MASLGPLDPLIRFIEYLVLEQPFGALFNTYAFILLFLPIALTAFALTAGAAPRRSATSLGNAKEDDPEPVPAAKAWCSTPARGSGST